MKIKTLPVVLATVVMSAATVALPVAAATSSQPWMNTRLSPDKRADMLVAHMNRQQKLQLVRSYYGAPGGPKGKAQPRGAHGSAGYVPGIPSLGIPAQQESDAGMGVANPNNARPGDGAVSLPSGLASAATWNPAAERKGGAMIGGEAWHKGFNVLLAGGADLVRDPRNGRNFEYAGEDPLLAGRMVAAFVRGIQSQHVITTVKHYALNDQETGRMTISSQLGKKAMRESDLLAFEIAVKRGHPGAVMCSYNKINGEHACQNKYLLTKVLKQDWGFKGYVMSDWGGVHSTAKAINAGLDQESAGAQFDSKVFFGKPLQQALASGAVSKSRLDDMAHRIVHSMFAVGLFEHPPQEKPVDRSADRAVAQHTLEQGAVLLRNAHHLLPLATGAGSVAVIGAHADKGVLAGGGSSVVVPYGGNAVPGLKPTQWPGPVMYDRSAPFAALRERLGAQHVSFTAGDDISAAVKAAQRAHTAVVFVHQWTGESFDVPTLDLPGNQNKLVAAVARANPRTVVVLENNAAVAMPWLHQVGAVLEAWYPGSGGGPAIANLLTGKVDPSGRLPVTFPRSVKQLPRQHIPGVSGGKVPATVDYSIEGANVGYRWFQKRGLKPLFAFGYGLSYTTFHHGTPHVDKQGKHIMAHVHVTNTGHVAGADVVQIYVQRPGSKVKRLAGFRKVDLTPGQSRTVDVTLAPRVLADFDPSQDRWTIPAGSYRVYAGRSAQDLGKAVRVHLRERHLAP